jgi:hypothetical protein
MPPMLNWLGGMAAVHREWVNKIAELGPAPANLILPTCSTNVEVETDQMGVAVLVEIGVADLGSMRDSKG